MSPFVLVLLVVAAVAHVGWNVAAKRVGAGGVLFVWLYQTVSVVLLLPVTTGALLLAAAPPRWSWLLAVVVSAVLHFGYAVLLQRGYAAGDMSVVYPVARGTGPLLSVLAAVLLLGERPGPYGLVGAAAVVLGVFVLGVEPGARRGSAGPSVLYGVLTGAAIASFTLWDAHAMTALALPPITYFCAWSMLLVLTLTPYALRHRKLTRQRWGSHRREVLTVAVLAPIAAVLVLEAMRLAPLTVVAPTREVSIVISSLFTWRYLGEPDPARRLVGAFIVLAGIVAMTVAG
jgi:drug/metabolite transporter (DMT)-like permease